MISVIFNPTP